MKNLLRTIIFTLFTWLALPLHAGPNDYKLLTEFLATEDTESTEGINLIRLFLRAL